MLIIFPAAFTSFETNNRYEVKNTFGQKVFIACEGKILVSLIAQHKTMVTPVH